MKKYFSIVCMLLLALVMFSCESSSQNQNSQITVNQAEASIGSNLDLKTLGEVVKTSSNPQEIEQKLNAADGINNLDLDGDGKTDYLKVTEYGKGVEHGYSVCAVLADGEPEVANVVVNTQSQQMSLNGNSNYYGNNNTYQTGISPGEMMLWMYLMRPNYSYYHSPYYYGHYGYGFVYRPIVPYHSYSSRTIVRTSTTRTYTRPTTRSTTTLRSPNTANHSAKATQRSSNFNNATRSQKSFQKTAPSTGPRNTSGFGNKSNSSSSTGSRNTSGFGNKSNSTPSKSYSTPSKSSGFGSSSKSSSSRSSSRSSSSSRSGRR